MDTKGPLNPESDGIHCFFLIVDDFSNYIVTVPTPQNMAHYGVNAITRHWLSKFGPPQNLITDGGTEYSTFEMENCCTLFNICHSPRTSHAPWTNRFFHVQNKSLRTCLRLFLDDIPKSWYIQLHFFAYAHITQPFSHLHISTYEIVFHTKQRIPVNFHLNVSRNSIRKFTAQFCIEVPPHSHYQSIASNHSVILKPLSTWFLHIETAVRQFYSKVDENTEKFLFPCNYNAKTTQVG